VLIVDGQQIDLHAQSSTVGAAALMLRTLGAHLDGVDGERRARLDAACDALAATDPHGTPETAIAHVVADALGASSATAAVMRCLNQGVVLPISMWLKAHTRVMSKDCTGADGWKIEIVVDGESVSGGGSAKRVQQMPSSSSGTTSPRAQRHRRVTVTHTRKEQSLGTSANETFTFAYALKFVLHSVTLLDCDARFVSFDWNDDKVLSRCDCCCCDILAQLAPAVKAALSVLRQWNGVAAELDSTKQDDSKPLPTPPGVHE
jgi:hypothetical protein